ncbi:MAG: hypothetical protein LBR53_05515 [Deltaproteobacteria bacterium]|jgi:hypothetical protein|nr:hypothetical protein [Deltaproteobacteria bacterium]
MAQIPGKRVLRGAFSLSDYFKVLDSISDHPLSSLAFRLFPYVLVDPAILFSSGWEDVDFENKIFTAPAWVRVGDSAYLPTRLASHRIPLPEQALLLLTELKDLTGSGRLLFPDPASRDAPLAVPSLDAILLEKGYPPLVLISFMVRKHAALVLESRGYDAYWIECQLDAGVRPKKDPEFYRSGEFLEEMRKMAGESAAGLDSLIKRPPGASLH